MRGLLPKFQMRYLEEFNLTILNNSDPRQSPQTTWGNFSNEKLIILHGGLEWLKQSAPEILQWM